MNYFRVLSFLVWICLLVKPSLSFASSTFFTSIINRATSPSPGLLIPLQEIRRFTNVIKQVKRRYVEPVADDKLFENAIRGVLSKMDPHSSYLDAEELKELTTATLGKFGGVGIEIAPDKGAIRVISPVDGTPAYKAGIKAGDLIIKIDDQLVKNMTMREAVNKMRGKKGTKVVLTIMRSKAAEPIQFNIIRDIIKIQTVKSKMLEKGYGYIRVSLFQEPTAADLIKAIKQLKEEFGGKLKGLVLDLRNNPGGLLDSAIDVTDQFLDSQYLKNKKIVYTKGRNPQITFEANASKRDSLNGTPMVVLINEGSASGSEIVAGALQDHQRAIIMGTRSFGKGSVQTVIPIDEESAIKLTTALYYTPLGRSIQAEGIQPDVWVDEMKIDKGDDGKKEPKIQEEELYRHLEDLNTKKEKIEESKVKSKEETKNNQESEKNEIKEKDLAHTDFQLYQGLNLLKGLSAINSQ